MNDIKTTLTHRLLPRLGVAVFGVLFFATAMAPAAFAGETCGSTGNPNDEGGSGVPIAIDVDCGGDANPIYAYAKGIIKFLALGVGILVVGMIIFGGIAYASARGDSGQVEKAKMIILNAIIVLLLFIFMSAILNFIIPGGIL